MTQTRVQRGVPTGGQFAASVHDEASGTLDDDAAVEALIGRLNDEMPFDHVIRITDDHRLESVYGEIYAPEVYGDEILSDDWEWMDGYSGQEGYSGPHMHSSEFIGGRIARDIVETPGVYVAVTVECDHDPDYCDHGDDPDAECSPIGWGVLRRKD